LRILKISAVIFGLFILLVALMLLRKGILAKDKFLYFRKIPEVWVEKFPLRPFSFGKEEKVQESTQQEEILLALREIQRQRKEMEREREELKNLQNHLSLQKEELREEGERLVSLKKKLEELIEQEKIKQSERISWLASIYEEMRPEEAAPIMEKLDDDLVISILSQMDERQAGKILGAMEPTRATELSQKIGKDVIKQILEESKIK